MCALFMEVYSSVIEVPTVSAFFFFLSRNLRAPVQEPLEVLQKDGPIDSVNVIVTT